MRFWEWSTRKLAETGFGETSQLDFSDLGTVGADLLEADFCTEMTSG
jgi:hypothetical protein